MRVLGGALLACLLACPLGAGGAGFRGVRTCLNAGSCPLVVCSLLLSALRPFVRCDALEICLYSHFKAVFSAVWAFRVDLFVLGALRGLCGFCARVELGGLKTFCVFAFLFALLLLLFGVSACVGVSGFRGFRTCRRLALVLWSRVPLLLPALLLCARCDALEICLHSHFKAVYLGL